MDINKAEKILNETKQNYNLIFSDFSRTRNKFWEELSFLTEFIGDKERVLDLGCGNGRLCQILYEKKIDYYGVDFSEKLIEIAKERHPNFRFQVADALNLPFPRDFFDKVISIAVFHHIPSKELRLKFLRETRRVLSLKGRVILSVWDFSFKRRVEMFFNFFFWKIFKKKDIDFNDALVPWGNKLLRYVHIFSQKEIIALFKEAGLRVISIQKKKRPKGKEGNIIVLAEKID